MTTELRHLTCEEASDLAPLFVLDALDPDERKAVADHLAGCRRAHDEFAELGAAVPALAAAVEPLEPPRALKGRVMAAYRAEMVPARAHVPATQPWADQTLSRRDTRPAARPWFSLLPAWPGWAAAAAALAIVAVVGAWGLSARADADRARLRAAELSTAIAAMSQPGSSIAVLQGSGAAAGASGFAAFPETGGGYVVVVDLPAAPAGQTYQAWYIADGTPASAGLLTVGGDRYAILANAQPVPGTTVVALTLEPAGGSSAPTSDPIVVGEVSTTA